MHSANLRTFQSLHPDATITKVDHASECIFFTEKGREWVLIFAGFEVEGVWDVTPDDWSEAELIRDKASLQELARTFENPHKQRIE